MWYQWEQISLLDANINHSKNGSALSANDQKMIVKGKESHRESTAGGDIYYEWKDSSTSWEKLSNLKELHPIQMLNMP